MLCQAGRCGELIGVIDGVAAFVAQQHLAPFGGAAFHFEHQAEFQRLQARVREIKRNGDGAGALGGKPFVAEIAIGAEGDAAQREVVVKLAEARFEFGAFDAHAEIADADGQEFFVPERGPRRRSRGGGASAAGALGGGARADCSPRFPSLYPNGAAAVFEDWPSVGSKRKRAERSHELDRCDVAPRAWIRHSLLNGVAEFDQLMRIRAEAGSEFVSL